MALTLDHLGYAVENIQKYLAEFFMPLFPVEALSEIVEDPVQKVRIAFVTLSGGIKIELIEPATEISPVTRILKANRGGLYHLCYSSSAFAEDIDKFKEKGCLLISDPTPAPAFNGKRVAFLLTPQHDLIEFIESESNGI